MIGSEALPDHMLVVTAATYDEASGQLRLCGDLQGPKPGSLARP
jgi:hypothetical protein